jgi:hypothetical protein
LLKKKYFIAVLIFLRLDRPTLFFQRVKLNLSAISHQQAVAEHWDLPNSEFFQSKDVASVLNIWTFVPTTNSLEIAKEQKLRVSQDQKPIEKM